MRAFLPRVDEAVRRCSAAFQPASRGGARVWQVEDRLPSDVLQLRQEKEASALPRFLPFGPWQKATPSLRDMHEWLNQENTAYAAKRLLEQRKPLDPSLLKSY
mmetsp:Transcript_18572/g.42599  ORF Transcript_18572/g.42599 Transcript_18572/m.42599 type:complete len:103 (+) Transcript_18572:1547-1855(+)